MKTFLVISATIVLVLALPVPSQAQNQVRSVNVGGTPVVPENLVNGAVPRLPDGKPDLTGPWLGGGSNADIESEGGLKPGELPLLPWAKELRDKRKEEDEPYTACLPMSVPRVNPYLEVRNVVHVEGADVHLHPARDRGRRRASRGLHGWPQASGRSSSDLVGPLDWVVGGRHARHR